MDPITRRDFMRASGVALLGAGLAACGGATTKKQARKTLSDIAAGRTQNVSVISVSGQVMARASERFPFALFDPKTNAPFSGGTARVWVAKDQTSPALGPFDATFHGDGLGDKGIYVARVPFAEDGAWLVLVEATPSGAGALVGGTQVGVGRRSKQPAPGDKPVSVPSPTTTDHRGVEPICTAKPQCSMHGTSLDVALANGKPTVLVIGTPAFCASKVCGPVVENIEAVKKQTAPGTVNFVHVEVYADDKEAVAKQTLAPAAAAWNLEFEPATYFIPAGGTIAEWFIGPAGLHEIAEQTKALTA